MADNETTTTIEPTPVGDLASGLDLLNRTRTLINDSNEDPLDITPAKAPEKVVEVEDPDSKDEQGTEEEDSKEEDPKIEKNDKKEDLEKERLEYKEKFTTDLNEILTESVGVDLKGISEVLVELLQWRNDILSIELEKQNKQSLKSPNDRHIPETVRPQNRPGVQTRNYDFTQSEIDSMSDAEYKKNRQAITNAYIQNRVRKDV